MTLLAGFDAPTDALGDEGDMALVLEESAFGDAFHHAEAGADVGVDVDMVVGLEVEAVGDAAAAAEAGQGESV